MKPHRSGAFLYIVVNRKFMRNIFEVLDAIKIKPELYIGSKNLTFLYHFINGYLFQSTFSEDSERIRELLLVAIKNRD
jgi:hypothetical protein